MGDTDVLIILSTIAILLVVCIMFMIYSVFLRKKAEFIYNQKMKEAFFERELAASQIEIKEQMLNYIGQELHDDLGQKLSVAKMMTSRSLSVSGNEDQEMFDEVNQLIGECIQDIRNLSKTFITENIVHFGIIDSLEKEIQRIEKLKLVEVDFNTNIQDVDINSKHSLILFRIIQECINNSLKHANAKNIKIDIEDQQDQLKVMIEDDGKGFLFGREIESGSGLKNMSNRAKLIGAVLDIKSTKNLGTRITINYKK